MKKQDFYYEKQQEGQCSRHAMNHALGRELLTESEYIDSVVECYVEKFNFSLENAKALLNSSEIDLDPAMIPTILEKKGIVGVKIEQFNLIKDSLIDFVGESLWMIIGVAGNNSIDIDNHSIPRGHFVAARKDDQNQWWLIDSLKPKNDYTPIFFETLESLKADFHKVTLICKN